MVASSFLPRPHVECEGRARAKPFARRPGAAPRPGEPVFSRDQVALNDGSDGKPIWITYKDGVYDVTKFESVHPGGGLIKQAAGADVSVFWDFWAHHHHADKVGSFLEELRIGALRKEDQIGGEMMGVHGTDPYEGEPRRVTSLQRAFAERPYVSETPNDVLDESYLTSAKALYVRNHAPVPECAFEPSENHEILFGDTALTTIEIINRFEQVEVTSVLQCAGNRASEDIAATGPNGFSGTIFETITQGMMGNAVWRGVLLSEVLPALFPNECKGAQEQKHGKVSEWHVWFTGEDGYSASTPLARIISSDNKCMLATHMNGESISADHGFPMRALIPGVAGARSVKWLSSISLQRVPVDAPWNSYYYKDNHGAQIQELPLQSVILNTREGKVSGVAYGGGSGNAISKVEVSLDNGKSWKEARLKLEEVVEDSMSNKTMKTKNFGWVQWELELELDGEGGASVCCRATDSEGVQQPEISVKKRGYLFNGWSKAGVKM